MFLLMHSIPAPYEWDFSGSGRFLPCPPYSTISLTLRWVKVLEANFSLGTIVFFEDLQNRVANFFVGCLFVAVFSVPTLFWSQTRRSVGLSEASLCFDAGYMVTSSFRRTFPFVFLFPCQPGLTEFFFFYASSSLFFGLDFPAGSSTPPFYMFLR